MIPEDRPGYTWCGQCAAYIDDEFTDHAEQHEAAAVSQGFTGNDGVFWGICLIGGALAGLFVTSL